MAVSEERGARTSRRQYWVLTLVLATLTLGSLLQSAQFALPQDTSNYDTLLSSVLDRVTDSAAGAAQSVFLTVEHRSLVQQALEQYRQDTQGAAKARSTLQLAQTADGSPPREIDLTRAVPRIADYARDKASRIERNLYPPPPSQANTNDPPATSPSPPEQEPLNIVLFYADDWTLKALGALNPDVSTPHIDEMAANGVLFTHNCVTTSICWISRNTLATGVYAAVHRNVKISSMAMFNETIQWPQTLFPQLKSAGYYTGMVGKWHAPSPREFMSYTFDVMNIYYGRHWMTRQGVRRHVTDCNGEDALQFLRSRPKDKRFALAVNFFATHAMDYTDPPYQPMEESMALYVNDTIAKPKTATEEHWKALPWFFNEQNEGRKRWRNRYDTDENYQDKIKNLYRLASEVDAVVGAVVEELKAQGVYDKTLLVFTTDNGNLQGEHGLAEKWYPWEESIRVPLVIQDPRMPPNQRGRFNDEFTLSVDLAPTLLSAANIPVPPHMQGRDIAELYLNPEEAAKTWRQDFFYEWTQGRNEDAMGHGRYFHIPAVFALIRKDYKFFYWPQTNYEQLFHVETDSYEEWDVVNSTAQTTTEALTLMKARYQFMKEWAQSGKPV